MCGCRFRPLGIRYTVTRVGVDPATDSVHV